MGKGLYYIDNFFIQKVKFASVKLSYTLHIGGDIFGNCHTHCTLVEISSETVIHIAHWCHTHCTLHIGGDIFGNCHTHYNLGNCHTHCTLEEIYSEKSHKPLVTTKCILYWNIFSHIFISH